MTIVLEYKKFGLRFYSICPKTSNTISKRETILDPYGVSIVGYFEDQQQKYDDVIKHLEDLGLGFVRVKKLHFTLLSLFDEKRKQNPFYLRSTITAVKKFFEGYKSELSGPLNIKINLIRPGSWYNNDMKEIHMLSDGTVVAMADLEDSDTQKFTRVGNLLARYLQEELPYIFNLSFGRKFPSAVWCTLGYFDHDDFEITENIRDSFNFITRNIITVNIKEVQIIEFSKRTLDDARPIGIPFPL